MHSPIDSFFLKYEISKNPQSITEWQMSKIHTEDQGLLCCLFARIGRNLLNKFSSVSVAFLDCFHIGKLSSLPGSEKKLSLMVMFYLRYLTHCMVNFREWPDPGFLSIKFTLI